MLELFSTEKISADMPGIMNAKPIFAEDMLLAFLSSRLSASVCNCLIASIRYWWGVISEDLSMVVVAFYASLRLAVALGF
ncbi:TPA: hypothetical protein ENX78_16955 [Candidatus Poribacteria bacterium]|nr:hypothetical protein [Candidatus Poribacteria bacterium]